MPTKSTTRKAKEDLEEGKSPSTAAGEFVREQMDKRSDEDGPKSRKQAIAIGLSEARRAGIPLKPPKKGQASERTRRKAERDLEKGREG